VVLGEAHLRRILKAYAAYYNGVRTHLASLRIHRPDALFSGSVRSLRGRFSADFIINIVGSSFQQGQVC
jgi:hypothetical protein